MSRILYRHDVESKYASRSEHRTRNVREATRRTRKGVKQVQTSQDTPVSHDGVLRAALLDHFRNVADPSRFYALRMNPGSTVEGVLNEPLAKRQKRPTRILVCDVDLCDDDVDVHDGGLPGVGGDDASDALAEVPQLYFRVVHAKPSAMHTVRAPLAAGRRLSANHVAITTHKIMNVGSAETVIESKPCSVKGASVVAVDGFETVDVGETIESFTSYSVADGLKYGVDGEFSDNSAVSAAITSLVHSGAFPNKNKFFAVPQEEAGVGSVWHVLDVAGIVHSIAADGGIGNFTLSKSGMARLRWGCGLVEPKLVCEVRQHLAIADRITFELIRMLDAAGWAWRAMPQKTKDRYALVYSAGGPRNWYSTLNVNKLYLLCLLSAEALHEKGLTPIPHYAADPSKVWGYMLKGINPNRPALCCDIDDVDVMPQPAGLEVVPAGYDLEAALGEMLDDLPPSPLAIEDDDPPPPDDDQDDDPIPPSTPRDGDDDPPPPDDDRDDDPPPSPPAIEDDDPPPPDDDQDDEDGDEGQPPPPAARCHRPGVVQRWGAFRISHLTVTKARPFGAVEAFLPLAQEERDH